MLTLRSRAKTVHGTVLVRDTIPGVSALWHARLAASLWSVTLRVLVASFGAFGHWFLERHFYVTSRASSLEHFGAWGGFWYGFGAGVDAVKSRRSRCREGVKALVMYLALCYLRAFMGLLSPCPGKLYPTCLTNTTSGCGDCASFYVGRFFGLPIRANHKASALHQRGRDNPQAAAHEVLRWLLLRLDFVGISERYDASLCLFWYVTVQMRQFQNACPCDSPHRRKGLGKHTNSMTRLTAEINLTHTPAHLNVSDAYIEGLAQADILLYRALDAVFVANVRRVENITRTQFLCE